MAGPIRSSSRASVAKALAASPAASPARPATPAAAGASSSTGSTSASTSRKPPTLVQGTLTASLGLNRQPPPLVLPKKKAAGKAAAVEAAETGPSTLPIGDVADAPPASPETLAAFRELFPKLGEDKLPLLRLELETMGKDWLEVLSKEMVKPDFLALKTFVLNEQRRHTVFPPPADIYAFSRLSKLRDVKVVVIGQDPYHGAGQAHGLSFSVRRGVQVPPSLRNVYKEIALEYPDFKPPAHGDLTSWAEQGILLLNTSLTVKQNAAGSHSKAGWVPFTQSIISHLANDPSCGDKGKVFFCWGKHAEKMLDAAHVDAKRHLVLRSAHPSPLSASRGFFNTGHFRQADEWIKKEWQTDTGIDWASVTRAK